MRCCLALLTVIAATSAAHAEVEDVEVVPVARHTMTLGMLGGGGKLAGLDEGGFGPNLEIALGGGRWQYFTELGGAWVTLGGPGVDTGGYQLRGGIGARWIARSTRLDSSAAIDMLLEGFTGLSELWWNGGGRLLRADVGAGVGWQVRFLENRRFATRMMVRVAFGPGDPEPPKVVCAGSCPMTADNGNNTSIQVLLGFQW